MEIALYFLEILKRIGKKGKITGNDFSAEMNQKAKKRITKNTWNNIGLIQVDVTKFTNHSGIQYAAKVCTLGMSIIQSFFTFTLCDYDIDY